jgi:hypothetical protein
LSNEDKKGEQPKERAELKKNPSLTEGLVSASSVADIRKGIVSGSSVQQARADIEQPKKTKDK